MTKALSEPSEETAGSRRSSRSFGRKQSCEVAEQLPPGFSEEELLTLQILDWVRCQVPGPELLRKLRPLAAATALAQATDQLLQREGRQRQFGGEQRSSSCSAGATEEDVKVNPAPRLEIRHADDLQEAAQWPMRLHLQREVERFSHLLQVVAEALDGLRAALLGLIPPMPEALCLQRDLLAGRTPIAWRLEGFAGSKRPGLAFWAKGLRACTLFFKSWQEQCSDPPCFPVGLLWSLQGLLMALLQRAARQMATPFVQLDFRHNVLVQFEDTSDVLEPPASGAYLQGAFLLNATWLRKQGTLGSAKPREVFCQLPVVHCVPVLAREWASMLEEMCSVPLYKTAARCGQSPLASRQPACIADVRLKPGTHSIAEWLLRGVALVCEKD